MVSARHIFPITAPDRTLNAATAVGICRSKPDRACRRSRRRAAFPEILGFAQRAPGDLPSDDDAAQKWIFHARNFHLMFRSKNQAPESLPRPDLYGARCTSDRAAISISIATTEGDVKLPTAPPDDISARRQCDKRFDPPARQQSPNRPPQRYPDRGEGHKF
jgi:hypothetical protein